LIPYFALIGSAFGSSVGAMDGAERSITVGAFEENAHDNKVVDQKPAGLFHVTNYVHEWQVAP
jgi:hypothetical protein